MLVEQLHCLLPIVYRLLLIACCLLPIAYYLSPIACCLLPIACCPLPIEIQFAASLKQICPGTHFSISTTLDVLWRIGNRSSPPREIGHSESLASACVF